MIYRKLLLASCAAPLVLISGHAQAKAAEQPAPAAESEDTSGQLGDIVVTAQRRKERLQNVPVVVSAFTERAIEQFHLVDGISTSKFVPGMISQHNAGLASANAYYLRGLGNSLSTATFDAPVTTYVDDVYIARQNANNYAFFDTERVEVLRGPQGTLFGRNTTGGAINVILRKPSPDAGLTMEATGGSYNRYTLKATADVPLSDTVLTKLSGYIVHDEGFLKNITTGDTLNGEKNYGVRGDVRLLPTEALTIDLSAEYSQNRSTYGGVRAIAGGINPYLTTPSASVQAAITKQNGSNPFPQGPFTTTPIFYETAVGLPQTDCNDNNLNLLLTTGAGSCNLSDNFAATSNISYDTGGATINSITAYRKLTQGYISQYDANNPNKYTGYIIADNGVNEQYSQELKINGDMLDKRLHYVAGIFYLHEKTNDRVTTFSGGSTTAFSAISDVHLLHKVETAAVYAQFDYDFTDQLTVTLGGRYTWERKNLGFLGSAEYPALGYTTADVVANRIPIQQTVRKFTPRIAVSYKVTPDIMLFASATNGFKSGGWNGSSANAANATNFRPELTWSYEAGMKSELFNKMVRFNINGYFARTKDLQAVTTTTNPFTNAIASLPLNAGTLEVYGLEVESSFQLGRDLNLFANPSYMHGEYTSIVPSATRLNTDIVPVRVPKFQFSGGINYMTPVEALGGSIGGTVTYRHNSSYFVALLNTTFVPHEDYVDASINYKTSDEKFALSAEVSNLTKQNTVTVNFLSLFPGDPRRFTVRAKMKF